MGQRNVLLLTSDRYSPWNNQDVNSYDRIWGSLNEDLQVPFLVYRTQSGPQVGPQFPKHFSVDARTRDRKVWVYFGVSLLKSVGNAIWHRNKRFLLITLRRTLVPSFLWYWTYAHVRRYCEDSRVDVIVYHGEFNAWGRAVAWACRDAGTVAVAWQHGAIGALPISKPRRGDSRLPLPHHLFVWSESARSRTTQSLARHVSCSVGGTSRLQTVYAPYHGHPRARLLFCPSTYDLDGFLELAKVRTLLPAGIDVAFRSHPLRRIGNARLNNFALDTGDLETSLNMTGAVVVGLSTVGVEALRREIPIIVPMFLMKVADSPYVSDQAGVFLCETIKAFVDACGEAIGSQIRDRSRFHSSARYFAQDLQRNHVRKILCRLGSEAVPRRAEGPRE